MTAQPQFICVSDTHGTLPLPDDESSAVAWLHAGDFLDARSHYTSTAREVICNWVKERSIPMYGVRGNHDIEDDVGLFDAVRDVGGFVHEVVPGLFVAGVGWHGQYYYDLPTEGDLLRIASDLKRQALRKMSTNDRLILLTHYPALLPECFTLEGSTDGRVYQTVRNLIGDLRPLLVVQGHVHQWFGSSEKVRLGSGPEILVINPGPTPMRVRVNLIDGSACIE